MSAGLAVLAFGILCGGIAGVVNSFRLAALEKEVADLKSQLAKLRNSSAVPRTFPRAY